MFRIRLRARVSNRVRVRVRVREAFWVQIGEDTPGHKDGILRHQTESFS